jgi:hypothetical protein
MAGTMVGAMKLARVGRVALMALATILLTELMLRCYASISQTPRGLRFDADIGHRPLPGIVKVGPHWSAKEPARTNTHGWRDAEHDFARVEGRFRFVAVGDSFTWGAEVDYGERYTEFLEQKLGGGRSST